MKLGVAEVPDVVDHDPRNCCPRSPQQGKKTRTMIAEPITFYLREADGMLAARRS